MAKYFASFFLCASCLILLPLTAQAQPPRRMARDVVEVSLGGSTVLRISQGGKVTMTDPTVADVSSITGGLLLVGRRVGETNLIMHGGGRRATYLIKVTLPARAIQSELIKVFPDDEISARAVGGALVLTGTVRSATVVTQAEQLALGYLASPSIAALGVQPKVINLLNVSGQQQVQLEVKFAEVNRQSLREMGVNLIGGSGDGRVGTVLGQGAAAANSNLQGQGGSTFSKPAQLVNGAGGEEVPIGAFFVGMPDGRFPFAATLRLLATRKLAKTLAEPTLIAMSGQDASFLAGGEVPVLIPTNNGVQIEFKKFGIILNFTPTVMGDETIQLKTYFEVSSLDPTVGLTFSGLLVSGFKTRQSATTVRLRSGQSFAIAGLLSNEIQNTIKKVPGLGDIPILGALFSSKAYERRETELMVVVTARLIDPMDEGRIPDLPGQYDISDPTDIELFLLNTEEASGKRDASGIQGQQTSVGSRQPIGKVGFWR